MELNMEKGPILTRIFTFLTLLNVAGLTFNILYARFGESLIYFLTLCGLAFANRYCWTEIPSPNGEDHEA